MPAQKSSKKSKKAAAARPKQAAKASKQAKADGGGIAAAALALGMIAVEELIAADEGTKRRIAEKVKARAKNLKRRPGISARTAFDQLETWLQDLGVELPEE